MSDQPPRPLSVFGQMAHMAADRIENDAGAMTATEIADCIRLLALNLDDYISETVLLRVKLENALAGAELGQQMMDSIEKGRQQHQAKAANRTAQEKAQRPSDVAS